MANNRLKKIALLPLLLTLGLTACSSDEIVAKPTNYNDNIVTSEDKSLDSVYRNINKIIADAYHDGGTFASDVLEKALYQYAVSVLGAYNRLTAANTEVITLKDAAKSASSGDHTKAKKFVDEHKAYQTSPRDETKEMQRVIAKWNTIEERIAEKMYEKFSTSSSADRSIYSEELFVKSLAYDLQSVTVTGDYYENLLFPSIEPKEVFTKNVPEVTPATTMLHRDHYQYNGKLEQDETPAAGAVVTRYIEDEIIPTIYNELLTEQYVLNESYNVLGRSNARKVNVISVTGDNNNITAAKDLMLSLLDRIFTTKTKEVVIDGTTYGAATTLYDFKAYSKIWNGVADELSAKVRGADGTLTTLDAIATQIFGTVKTTKPTAPSVLNYYDGTAYGKLAKEYEKITNDPYTNDSSVESSYTNSGAYPIATGLQIKTNEIKLKDYTQSGWYIKNGGLSDLPETIRTRLFNMAVATGIPEGTTSPTDRAIVAGEDITYKVPETESRYVARINGAYYLKTSTQAQGSDEKEDILFFDSSTSTYYIVQVEEAANNAKFATSTQTGSTAYSADKLPTIESAIVKLVATTESYQTLAKKHWVEKMCVTAEEKYHDQSVYDYFKSNFPDLFED